MLCWRAAAAVAIVAASAGRAAGSPVADPYLGGAVFTGPTHAHAAALFYNPAAVALDPGTHFYLSGTLRLDQISVDRAPIEPTTGEPGGSRPIDPVSTNNLTPGGLVGIYSDFNGSRITLGFGVYAPHVERFTSGADPLRYHSRGGYAVDIYYTPSVAFRINRRFVVGFGVSVVSSSLRLEFSRDTALEAGSVGLSSTCGAEACGAENPLATQDYRVNVNSFLNVSGNLGATLQTAAGWVLGLSINSPPGAFGRLDVESRGDVSVTAAPRDGGAALDGRARVTYQLPWSIHVGARGPLVGDYELIANLSWITTGRQREIDLRMYGGNLADANVPAWYPRYRGLRDVIVGQVGVEGRDHRRLRLGARLRAETAGVDAEAISPVAIAGWNVGAALGAELRPSTDLALSLSYALAWYPTQAVDASAYDPRARIDCIDGGAPLDGCTAAAEGRGIPTAAGDYGRLQHALTLGLRYDWF